MVRVEIERLPASEGLPLPGYESAGASGMDVRAAVPEKVALAPGEVKLIPTGLRIAVPRGYEVQVRPRSGLALKHGVTVLNAPGTVDSDYRGELGVILANFGGEAFAVERGMRVAQLVVQSVERAEVIEVEALPPTERGEGGFGSSGLK